MYFVYILCKKRIIINLLVQKINLLGGEVFVLRERIESKAPVMSPNQRKIASYVQANLQSVAFQTASEVCKKIGISASSIVRFAQFLDYESYAEFRRASYQEFMMSLSTEERFKESDKSEGGSYSEMFQRDIDAISLAKKNLSSGAIDGMAQSIVSAPSVYVAAARGSHVSAYHLVYHLSWLLPDIRLLPYDYSLEVLSNAHKSSLVIGIDFPRYLSWTIDVMRHALAIGLTVGAITDSPNSPLAENVDPKHLLAVPYRTISFVDSCASVISTINCIVLAVSRLRKDSVAPQLRNLETLWKSSGVYIDSESSTWMTSLNGI